MNKQQSKGQQNQAQGFTKVGSTQPGKKDDAGKAAKKAGRKMHPLVDNKDTKVYPFASTPPDFDFKGMKPLKKKDFVGEGEFLEYKAAECEAKAADFREKAKEAKLTGNKADKSKAKRLKKIMSKAAELREQLKAQGVDVDALLAAADETEDEKKS